MGAGQVRFSGEHLRHHVPATGMVLCLVSLSSPVKPYPSTRIDTCNHWKEKANVYYQLATSHARDGSDHELVVYGFRQHHPHRHHLLVCEGTARLHRTCSTDAA